MDQRPSTSKRSYPKKEPPDVLRYDLRKQQISEKNLELSPTSSDMQAPKTIGKKIFFNSIFEKIPKLKSE